LILTLVALAATAAFAGNKQSINFSVSSAVQVGSKTLAPGDYTVTVTRTGNDAKMVFQKNGVEVATSDGVYTETRNCSADFAVLTDKGANITELCGYKFKGGIKLTGTGSAASSSAGK
jgi:hypothetical protein